MTDVRILSEPLGGSPLSLLMQRGEAPRDWLREAPAGPAGWRELAAERARSGLECLVDDARAGARRVGTSG